MTSVLRRRTLAAAVSIFVLLVIIVQLVPFYVAVTTSLKAKTDISPLKAVTLALYALTSKKKPVRSPTPRRAVVM